MSNPILKQAVIIGAGMDGLAAAKAVAPHFENVIAFDRDALPDVPAPRSGTPQVKQVLAAMEIEALAPSTSAPTDERWEPVSLDGEDYPSKPQTQGRAALRWFIDTLALAGCGMAGVYVGVWLDPPTSPETRSQEDRPDRVI